MSFTTDDQFNQNMATLLGNNYVDDLKQRGYITAQIIKHRHEKKMSQQELANQIGISQSTIGRLGLEAGLTQPNYQTLLAISKALDTPLTIDAKYDGVI